VLSRRNFPRVELAFVSVEKAKGQQRIGSSGSRYDELRKLKELHDQDALTDEEFEREKRKILRVNNDEFSTRRNPKRILGA